MFLRSPEIKNMSYAPQIDSKPLLNAVSCNLSLLRPVFAYVNTHTHTHTENIPIKSF